MRGPLRQQSPQAQGFPIPMRGNETIEAGYPGHVQAEFPIPMRGNE